MAAVTALKLDETVSHKQQKVPMANQFLDPFLDKVRRNGKNTRKINE
jgi:hypothetical protein